MTSPEQVTYLIDRVAAADAVIAGLCDPDEDAVVDDTLHALTRRARRTLAAAAQPHARQVRELMAQIGRGSSIPTEEDDEGDEDGDDEPCNDWPAWVNAIVADEDPS